MIRRVFLLVLLVILIAPFSQAINTCATILQPGVYTIDSDIAINSGEFNDAVQCIKIQTPNVTLDCQNHVILSDEGQFQNAIVVNASNVTIKNCVFQNFAHSNSDAIQFNANGEVVSNLTIFNSVFNNIYTAISVNVLAKNVNISYSRIESNKAGASLIMIFSNDSIIQNLDLTSTGDSAEWGGVVALAIGGFNVSVIDTTALMTGPNANFIRGNAKNLRVERVNALLTGVNASHAFFFRGGGGSGIIIDSTLNASGQGGFAIEADGYYSVYNSIIHGAEYALLMNFDNSGVNFSNTQITSGKIIVNEESSYANLFNTTVPQLKFSSDGPITVIQPVIINVNDAGIPIENALVYVSNYSVQNALTNIDGNAFFNVTTRIVNENNNTFYENLTINASKAGYNATQTNVTVISAVKQNQQFNLQISRDVNSCVVLSSPGRYTLTQSISSDGSLTPGNPRACVNITSANVELNCNNYAIFTRKNTNPFQVAIETNSSNVSIQNCLLYNYSGNYGIKGRFASNVNISNVTIHNSTAGIQIQNSNAINVNGFAFVSQLSDAVAIDGRNLNNSNFTNTVFTLSGKNVRAFTFNNANSNTISNSLFSGTAPTQSEFLWVIGITSNFTINNVTANSSGSESIVMNLNADATISNSVINAYGSSSEAIFAAKNTAISNTVLNATGNASRAFTGANVLLNDVLIHNGNLSAVNSTINATNSSFALNKVYAKGTGQVYVISPLQVSVTSNQAPLEAATVTVTNYSTQTTQSDANGLANLNITTLLLSATGITNYSFITIQAAKQGFDQNTTNTTLNAPVMETQLALISLTQTPVPPAANPAGGGGGGGGGGSAAATPSTPIVNVTNQTQNATTDTNVTNVTSIAIVEVPASTDAQINTTNQTIASPATGQFTANNDTPLIAGVIGLIVIILGIWYFRIRK